MSNPVVAAATAQLGKPYVFGAPSSASNPDPASFDCSGLVMWCYAKVGVKLPHNAAAQYAVMGHRPVGQVQPGDVMFWYESPGGGIGHCAIYIGNGQIIEAPEPGKNVQQKAYNYWKEPLPNVGIYTGPAAVSDSTDSTKASSPSSSTSDNPPPADTVTLVNGTYQATVGGGKTYLPDLQGVVHVNSYTSAQWAAIQKWIVTASSGSYKTVAVTSDLTATQVISAYNSFLRAGQGATTPDIGAATPQSLLPAWTDSLTSLLSKLLWLVDPANWQRIGLFVLGGGLLTLAMLETFGVHPTDVAKAAV